LPHRTKIDSLDSFDLFVKQVQNECFQIIEHTYFPLQNLINYFNSNQTSSIIPFLNILFDFITYSTDNDLQSINDTHFESISLTKFENIVKFHLKSVFFFDSTSPNPTMSCSFICSKDLFDLATIEDISQQFQDLLSQLFNRTANTNTTTISQLSRHSLKQSKEMHKLNFSRLSNIYNHGKNISSRKLPNKFKQKPRDYVKWKNEN
ncbi:unnamed protein product, partial [Adineta ricciae]